nr:2A1 [Potamipivirus A]
LATLRTWLKDGALCNCWNLASDLALNASNALDEDEPLMNFVTHNNTRVTNLDKLMEKTEEAGWLRDLTREGVEENPGPNYG